MIHQVEPFLAGGQEFATGAAITALQPYMVRWEISYKNSPETPHPTEPKPNQIAIPKLYTKPNPTQSPLP